MENQLHQNILLVDCLWAIWKRRFTCFFIVFGITLGAVLYSFTLPSIFRSEATILPASSPQSPTGGLIGMIAGSSLLGGNGEGTLLLFSNSKALKLRVVKNPELMNAFFPNGNTTALSDPVALDEAVSKLGGMLKVTSAKGGGGVVSVMIESSDPALAVKVARIYLVELQNFLSNNSLAQTKRYRLFLEEQLAKNKEELLEMGKSLTSFYQRNTVSLVNAKLNVPIAVKTKEGIRNFKSYEEFKDHFDILQKEDQGKMGDVLKDGEEIKFVKDVPHQIYLQYLTVQQSMLEGNYSLLSQQYESARLEEAKLDPTFTVLDEPVLPKYRFTPRRTVIAFGAFSLSLVLSLVYVLFKEFGGGVSLTMSNHNSRGLREANVVY